MGRHQKITVCHLASGDLWAGAEAQVCSVVTELQGNKDIDVSAIILNNGELAGRLARAGVRTTIIDENIYGFRGILRRLEKHFEGDPVDLLHTHRFKENTLGALLKKRGYVRCLVQTVHGAGERFGGLAGLRAAATTAINRHYTRAQFDRVIAVSQDMAQHLGRWISREKITQIYNGIELSEVTSQQPSEKVKKELGLGIDDPLIGTAGRLVPIKGYAVLIKAARLVVDKAPRTRFVLAGDGPLREELQKQVHRLELDNRFLLTGFRSDIYDLIAAMDIFVMSSHHEGIPVVLLEAMALGRPVVVTEVGGMREVVVADTSGLFVPPDDPEQMATRILQLLENEQGRKTLGTHARAHITEKFSASRQCRKLVELYSYLTER